MVNRLSEATSRHLYITRVPTVHKVPSYVMVQRPYVYGFDTEYLGCALTVQSFWHVPSLPLLTLIREFVVKSPPYIQNAPEQCTYWGYLFQKGATHA